MKRMALVGIVSAALGGTLLTAPPAMAESYSSTVSVALAEQAAGHRGWDDRRFNRTTNINKNVNINVNDNRERRRHHRDWDGYWD